jgi:hypothetical protein
MFNNITNFLNLISNRKIKTASTLKNTDLITLGAKDPNYLGGYQPTAIRVDEFLSAVPTGVQSISDNNTGVVSVDNTDPSNPVIEYNGVVTDGVTISGNGTVSNPLQALVQTKYANVFFVDDTNGNNTTGLQNDFNKPFKTVAAAMTAITSVPDVNNKQLIYIRRGTYSTGLITLKNYVDIKCEEGVYFISNTGFTDNGQSVNFNFYGKSVFDVSGQTHTFGIFSSSSVGFIEVDSLKTHNAALIVDNNSSISLSARKIETNTFGTGYGISLRGGGNVSINITDSYYSTHTNFDFRNYTGRADVTCPKIFITSGNIYGGDNKSAISCIQNCEGQATFNANIYNLDNNFYTGTTSGIIRSWSDCGLSLYFKGNIFSWAFPTVYAGATGPRVFQALIEGEIISYNKLAYISIPNTGPYSFPGGTSQVMFKNCTLQCFSSFGDNMIDLGRSTALSIINCSLIDLTNSNIGINKLTIESNLYFYNSLYYSQNTFSEILSSSLINNPVHVYNVISNTGQNINITNVLSATGIIVDPLFKLNYLNSL